MCLRTGLSVLLECDLQVGKDDICFVHHPFSSISYRACYVVMVNMKWVDGQMDGWMDFPGLSGLSEPPTRVRLQFLLQVLSCGSVECFGGGLRSWAWCGGLETAPLCRHGLT